MLDSLHHIKNTPIIIYTTNSVVWKAHPDVPHFKQNCRIQCAFFRRIYSAPRPTILNLKMNIPHLSLILCCYGQYIMVGLMCQPSNIRAQSNLTVFIIHHHEFDEKFDRQIHVVFAVLVQVIMQPIVHQILGTKRYNIPHPKLNSKPYLEPKSY